MKGEYFGRPTEPQREDMGGKFQNIHFQECQIKGLFHNKASHNWKQCPLGKIIGVCRDGYQSVLKGDPFQPIFTLVVVHK